jgi:Tfp pilus assembly protein PilV
MKVRNDNGLSLVEILIATLVFSIALAAVVSSIAAIVDVIDDAKDTTVATADLRNMLEKMRATPFDSLVALFPHGAADGPMPNPYTTIVGGYTLANEHITVTYANPDVEPLEIHTLLTWQSKKGRAHNSSIATFKMR